MKIKKQPKTEAEATRLIYDIADSFGLQLVIISPNDFEDMMGTEGWSNKRNCKAAYHAINEVGELVGDAIDNAIKTVNSRKR